MPVSPDVETVDELPLEYAEEGERQRELFEDNIRIAKLERASAVIDSVNKAYGKHKLYLGTMLILNRHQPTNRDIQPWRKSNLLSGETERQHLEIPRWSITV